MRKVVTLFLILLFVAGCASSWKDTTKSTIVALIDSWDISMTALGNLYKAGKLSEEAKETAIKYGEVARLSLIAASSAVDASDSITVSLELAKVVDAIRQLKNLLGGTNAEFDSINSTGIVEKLAVGRDTGINRPYQETGGNFRPVVERKIEDARSEQRFLFQVLHYRPSAPH